MPLPLAQLYGYSDYGKVFTIDPSFGVPSSIEGASAGGGLRLGWTPQFVADLSAAKAIEGPRNDWRFFFILTAKH
jgi:hypothetical protein